MLTRFRLRFARRRRRRQPALRGGRLTVEALEPRALLSAAPLTAMAPLDVPRLADAPRSLFVAPAAAVATQAEQLPPPDMPGLSHMAFEAGPPPAAQPRREAPVPAGRDPGPMMFSTPGDAHVTLSVTITPGGGAAPLWGDSAGMRGIEIVMAPRRYEAMWLDLPPAGFLSARPPQGGEGEAPAARYAPTDWAGAASLGENVGIAQEAVNILLRPAEPVTLSFATPPANTARGTQGGAAVWETGRTSSLVSPAQPTWTAPPAAREPGAFSPLLAGPALGLRDPVSAPGALGEALASAARELSPSDSALLVLPAVDAWDTTSWYAWPDAPLAAQSLAAGTPSSIPATEAWRAARHDAAFSDSRIVDAVTDRGILTDGDGLSLRQDPTDGGLIDIAAAGEKSLAGAGQPLVPRHVGRGKPSRNPGLWSPAAQSGRDDRRTLQDDEQLARQLRSRYAELRTGGAPADAARAARGVEEGGMIALATAGEAPDAASAEPTSSADPRGVQMDVGRGLFQAFELADELAAGRSASPTAKGAGPAPAAQADAAAEAEPSAADAARTEPATPTAPRAAALTLAALASLLTDPARRRPTDESEVAHVERK